MDIGVMEILYCWQSLVLSAGVHLGTRSLKNAILLLAGKDDVKQAWARHVVIPIVPLTLGTIAAVVFPLHPDMLVKYIAQDGTAHPWLVYAAYGGAVGTFADYLHQRVNGALKIKEAVAANKEGKTPTGM